jgi:soluble lytic murein transglycosylase-like protein
MAYVILDADRQIGLDKKFEAYELKIAECNEQLGNYEKALQKKDTTVVPILLRLRPQLDVAVATEISKAVIKYSTQFRLPPEFVVYLMKRESGFNTLAVSKAGAVGLMQVMPKAHKDKMAKLGIDHSQLFHIDNNVRLGCAILREYYDKTGSIEKALKKYVGGHHTSYTQDILIGYTNETIPLKVKEPKQ